MNLDTSIPGMQGELFTGILDNSSVCAIIQSVPIRIDKTDRDIQAFKHFGETPQSNNDRFFLLQNSTMMLKNSSVALCFGVSGSLVLNMGMGFKFLAKL